MEVIWEKVVNLFYFLVVPGFMSILLKICNVLKKLLVFDIS
jgi:hypothetical protein